ncbi:intracellular short-chain-length polyhydroxyalkanoate depolymerase [Siminovitchia acidinfaciens]|uniref:intracellular short-chain-length polyhydroxyalkanoate depolymerase n=1 Tax=Siminovitchia acidinfaciens TaxID=2321395 RepID=UPI001F45C607|nr:alpha/beta hydrolase [Siminovitchia acidinfaciens]
MPNGEKLAYREREGGQNTIILVHGNMTSSIHWEPVIRDLSPEYKVYAVDLRGFGQSTYHKKVTSIKDFSDDLKMFVDGLSIKNFALVGWSLGGAVCQQFCSDYQGFCNMLFLLTSASSRGYPHHATRKNGKPDLSKRISSYTDILDDIKTRMIQAAYDKSDFAFLKQLWDTLIYNQQQPDAKTYLKHLEDMTAQRNLAECYHALNTFNISSFHNGLVAGEDKLKHINIPVLIAWGENDLVVTKEMTNELIEDFGDQAESIKLTGCGHAPMVDSPHQLIAIMESFLSNKQVSSLMTNVND